MGGGGSRPSSHLKSECGGVKEEEVKEGWWGKGGGKGGR